jgi:hypothetical protein
MEIDSECDSDAGDVRRRAPFDDLGDESGYSDDGIVARRCNSPVLSHSGSDDECDGLGVGAPASRESPPTDSPPSTPPRAPTIDDPLPSPAEMRRLIIARVPTLTQRQLVGVFKRAHGLRKSATRVTREKKPWKASYPVLVKDVLRLVVDTPAQHLEVARDGDRWKLLLGKSLSLHFDRKPTPRQTADISSAIARAIELATAAMRAEDADAAIFLEKQASGEAPVWVRHLKGAGCVGDSKSRPFFLRALSDVADAVEASASATGA